MNSAVVAAQSRRNLKFARQGLGWALLSGVLWGFTGVMLSLVLGASALSDPALWLLAPITVAALSDTCGALWLLAANARAGKLPELMRTLRSKPGRLVALGALCGGPLGMSAYLLGIKFAGPAYVMPITALYPAVASILAMIFLKEKISPRAWAGMALCIAGAAVIGYTTPEGGVSSGFYLGVALALVATLGWGSEGVLATAGMDLLDPVVALNVRQIVSGLSYLLVVLPLAGGFALVGPIVASDLVLAILGVSLLTALSYTSWYRGLNMAGVSRAMAMNITYSLWGILFSVLFTGLNMAINLAAGAIIITIGMLLVIGNPKDMGSLRSVN